jgi:hypothetical protein
MLFASPRQSERPCGRSDRSRTRLTRRKPYSRVLRAMLPQAWLDSTLKLCCSTIPSIIYNAIPRRYRKRERQRQHQEPTAAATPEQACFLNSQQFPTAGSRLPVQQLPAAKRTSLRRQTSAHATPKAVVQEGEGEGESHSQGTASPCLPLSNGGPYGVRRLPPPASDISDDILNMRLRQEQLEVRRERIAATRRAIVKRQKVVIECIIHGSTRQVKEAEYQKRQLDLALKLQCDRIMELE